MATARDAAQEFLNAIDRTIDGRPAFGPAYAVLAGVPESDPEKFQVSLLAGTIEQEYEAAEGDLTHVLTLRERMARFAAGAATAAEVETGRTAEENAAAAADRAAQLAEVERDRAAAQRSLALWTWAESIVSKAAIFGELPTWKVKVALAVIAALGGVALVVGGVVIVRRVTA